MKGMKTFWSHNHLVSKGEEVQESEEKPFYDCQGNGKEGKEEGIKKKKAKRKEDQLLVDKEEDEKTKPKKEAM